MHGSASRPLPTAAAVAEPSVGAVHHQRPGVSAVRRYAPLSVRLVEQALKVPGGGWGPVEDVLKLLPGGHYDVPFAAPDDEAGATHAPPTATGAQRVLPCCPLKIAGLACKLCHVL